ncbi:hypothetical protein [Wolbachia pipientis]|nr:hypothetical protein [Wolbachia pipientis]
MLDTGIQLLIENVVQYIIKFSGSQCLGTGMTPFWMETSVTH